jgi:hypothetical protein
LPTLTATITITTIPNMPTSVGFQVTGTYVLNQSTWTDELVYEDDHGPSIPISSPVVQVGVVSYSIPHDPMPPGTHTVSVKDQLTGSVVKSNTFTVGVVQAITANAPTGGVAGVPLTFTGSLTNYSAPPPLTYRLNGGAATPLTGVTTTGWSAQITIAAAGSYTLVVSDGAITSTPVVFAVSPVTVTHIIAPNPPAPTAGPNYIFYDTFTSLADITDNGGAGTTGSITILVGSGQTFTDQSGNVWSITPAGVAQQNQFNAGFTANLSQLSLVNGTIWQQNTSN